MICKKFYYIYLTTALFVLAVSHNSYSQIRWKMPKAEFSLSSGYDSNILRVSRDTDSNRVAGVIHTLNLKAINWIYWNPDIRSYLSLNTEYLILSGNDLDNNWNFFIKFKTMADILRKRKAYWIPEIKWDAEIRYAMVDKYYSDRALGDEFTTIIDRISGQRLALGDLFDRTAIRFSTGVLFIYDPLVTVDLEFQKEFRNYTDLGDINSETFYSLDNDESKIETSLLINPYENIDVRFGYDWALRDYEHKFANDIDGNELPELNRIYHYRDFDVSIFMEFGRFQGGIRYLDRTRADDYQGYFNYAALKWNLQAAYFFSAKWQLSALYEVANKEYDHITFSNEILQNNYITFETILSYKIVQNMSASFIFVNEIENSTYYKFTYDRIITNLTVSYQLP